MTRGELRIFPLPGLPEVAPGDDLSALIAAGLANRGEMAQAGDVFVVAQKVVSKSEGRLVDLASIVPSALALEYASAWQRDPRHVEVVLQESRRIVRMDRGLIIAETRHGFVCANAGVDQSNVPRDDTVCLLPLRPDESAHRLRTGLRDVLGVDIAVIIADSFGRPWRNGIVNVALGVSGLDPILDYRGGVDAGGRQLTATVVSVADELASAAELVMRKADQHPVAVVRGYIAAANEAASGGSLIMPPERDMFR